MGMDPVCGQKVDEERTPYKYEYEGTTYFFCSQGCKRALELRPDIIVKRIEEKRVPGMS